MARAALKDVWKLLSGNLLAKFFGVAALMLFTRLLTKAELAVFPAYLMLIGISSLFFSFGIFQTFVRKLPSLIREDEATARSLVVTGTAIVMAGILLVAAGALVWSEAIAGFIFRTADEGWVIRIMVLGFVASAFAKAADNIMWGRGQFSATSALQIIDSIVRPLLTIGLYFWLGFEGIVLGLVIAQIANAALSLYFVRDLFRGPLPRLYPVRALIAESLPFYIDGYLWYLKGDGDTLLISALLGPSPLAEYYVAKTLYSNVMLVLTSLDRVALERLARHAGAAETFREKAEQMQRHISQFMVPLTLWVIAITPYAMTVLAGSRYSDAKWPAVGLLVAALVQFLVIAVDRTVFVALSGFYRLSKTAVEAATALLVAIALVRPWQMMAVVAARVIGPLLGGVFGAVVIRRKFGFWLPFDSAIPAFVAGLPGTLAVLLLAPTESHFVPALLGALLGTVVWGAAFGALTYVTDRSAFRMVLSYARREYRAALQVPSP